MEDEYGGLFDEPPASSGKNDKSPMENAKFLLENLKNSQFKTPQFFTYLNDVSKLSQEAVGPTAICKAGGIPILMNFLHQSKDVTTDSQLIQAIISLCTNICLDREGPPIFRELGALSLMLEILHEQTKDPELTQRILYFLFNFSEEPKNQKLIRELGGISLFSRYLAKNLEDLIPKEEKLDTTMALCGLFWNLSYNDYNKIVIREEGVPQKMFQILKQKPFQFHKKLTCTAIGTIATLYDPDFCDYIAKDDKDKKQEVFNTKNKEIAKKYLPEYNYLDWEIKMMVETYFPELLKKLEEATMVQVWNMSEESFIGNTLELCTVLCTKNLKYLLVPRKEYFTKLWKRDSLTERITTQLKLVVNALEQE